MEWCAAWPCSIDNCNMACSNNVRNDRVRPFAEEALCCRRIFWRIERLWTSQCRSDWRVGKCSSHTPGCRSELQAAPEFGGITLQLCAEMLIAIGAQMLPIMHWPALTCNVAACVHWAKKIRTICQERSYGAIEPRCATGSAQTRSWGLAQPTGHWG